MGNPTNTGLHTNIRHRSKRYHAGEKEKSKADFTIFMVHHITHGGEGNPAYGVTNQKGAFALVSDDGRAEDWRLSLMRLGIIWAPWPRAAYTVTTTRPKSC